MQNVVNRRAANAGRIHWGPARLKQTMYISSRSTRLTKIQLPRLGLRQLGIICGMEILVVDDELAIRTVLSPRLEGLRSRRLTLLYQRLLYH